MDDNNPYAPPKSWAFDQVHLLVDPNAAWRDGNLLMTRKGAVLPDRCLKCNATAEGYQFERTLSWISPWWILVLLVLGPLLFAIVYLAVRKQGKVTVGLCPRHRSRRSRIIALSWVTGLAGVGSIIAAGTVPESIVPIPVIAGIVLLFVSLIGGSFGSRVLVPKRIKKRFFAESCG
jgi:hypothetical protein